jgi:hypothetical protein
VAEQRYIRAKLDLWTQMPKAERDRVRDQIRSIARGVERSALEACVLRGISPSTAAQLYRLNKGTIYRMMREFLEGFELWH